MAAADHDGDGDLDLLFAHWGNAWSGRPTHYLWRNNGRGAMGMTATRICS